ncbi:putative mitochondrial inner membrane protein [Elsinoe australis]|uniref:Putative mitochondrial inner membrane protein n=1 Tax=Elsinoe australis TaxID=40998 RepID=A0A4V6DXR8_9PEZI|nr:putative mitochondrial inner membrane protein [Elsinoe australis]
MMPSRGVQLGLRTVKASQFQSRHSSRLFSSSTSRAFVRPSTRPTLVLRSIAEQKRSISWNPTTWWPSNNESTSFTEAHKASNATTSTSTPVTTVDTTVAASPAAQTPSSPPVQPTTSPTNPATSSAVDTSSATSNLTEVNIPDPTPIPLPTEQIGYLKSLGLDYGWGPTSALEWTLEHIHVYSGLPWWGSIVLTSALIRLSFFPLLMRMSDVQARMAHIKPKLDEFNKAMMTAYRSQDQQGLAVAQQNMQNLRLRAGVSFGPMVANVGVNMIFAICALKLMRAMSSLPVPGFLNGGALWFTDLTVADPYYALPLIMAGAFHMTLRLGTEPGMEMYNSGGMRHFMLYGIPGLIFISMSWFSAGLNLWLASSGLVSISLGKLLQRPSFRERYGLMQTPKPGQGAPGQGMMSMFMGDQAEASTGNGKTIDVQPVKRANAGGVEYQAPRVRTSAYNASSAASSNRSASQNSNNKTSNDSRSTTPRVVNEEEVRPVQPPKGMLERYVEWGSDKINDMGKMYQSAGTQGKNFFNKLRGMAPEEKVGSKRNKDYLRMAENYEKQVQRRKEQLKERKR